MVVVTHLLRLAAQVFNDNCNGLVDSALKVHRVGTRSYVLVALTDNRLRKDSGSGRSVAGDIRSLARNLFHHLGAEVLNFVFERNFFGNSHAVLGHLRGAK